MTSSDMPSTAAAPAAAPSPAAHSRLRTWVRTAAASTVALAAVAAGTPGEASAISSQRGTHVRPFHVATFNVLGASHTVRGAKGMQPYHKRIKRTVSLVDDLKLSVIGFQELEEAQWSRFKELTGDKWAFWPGTRLGRNAVRNSVGWRRAIWKRVERHTYEVPYFHGNLVKNPYVKLRNRVTRQEVWFMNTHNPADAKGDAARWRRKSLRIQADLANRLEARGHPVVFTGDFNDREKAICPLERLTDLKSANGGGWQGGTCEVPRYSRIDHIFVSRRSKVTDYRLREGGVIDKITDHPVVTVRVAVPRR